MNEKITDLASRNAARRLPIADACRWSEALELILASNLRLAFAWQRTLLRSWSL